MKLMLGEHSGCACLYKVVSLCVYKTNVLLLRMSRNSNWNSQMHSWKEFVPRFFKAFQWAFTSIARALTAYVPWGNFRTKEAGWCAKGWCQCKVNLRGLWGNDSQWKGLYSRGMVLIRSWLVETCVYHSEERIKVTTKAFPSGTVWQVLLCESKDLIYSFLHHKNIVKTSSWKKELRKKWFGIDPFMLSSSHFVR